MILEYFLLGNGPFIGHWGAKARKIPALLL
jgi:hypothetical protein